MEYMSVNYATIIVRDTSSGPPSSCSLLIIMLMNRMWNQVEIIRLASRESTSIVSFA
jgi:hypothetical protein